MFVDTGLLHSGASSSHEAGGYARDGADHLSGASVGDGIFGGFPAADNFGAAVGAAHSSHVKLLQGHQQSLSSLGDNANTIAVTFTEMEDQNAALLKAVRCTSPT